MIKALEISSVNQFKNIKLLLKVPPILQKSFCEQMFVSLCMTISKSFQQTTATLRRPFLDKPTSKGVETSPGSQGARDVTKLN